MYSVTHITEYLLFLKRQQHLQISLHSVEPNPLIAETPLSSFNIHENAYCSFVKSDPAARKRCITQQCKAFRRCTKGSYIGTCYAGVKEVVYPVFDGSNPVAFISVSGYQTENPLPFFKAVCNEFSFDITKLSQMYNSLQPSEIDKQQIDILVFPVCDMLKLA